MQSVGHTITFEMAVPIARLFPLFSPEGERHWVPGWDYENVMGHTELAEAFVAGFTAAAYDEFIGEWKTLLERHFASQP
jgi:hypothetical protein